MVDISVGSNLSCSPHVQCLVSHSVEAAQATRGGEAPVGDHDREGDDPHEPEGRMHGTGDSRLMNEGQDQPHGRDGDGNGSHDDRDGDFPSPAAMAEHVRAEASGGITGDPEGHDDKPDVNAARVGGCRHEEQVRLDQDEQPPDDTAQGDEHDGDDVTRERQGATRCSTQ